MRAREFLLEGGWASTVTQGTVIHPSTVKLALKVMDKFITGFNKWSEKKNLPPVEIGYPTGSSAYHDVDPEDKIYGDIDLQLIIPEIPELAGKTLSQMQYFWNKQMGEYGKTLKWIHPESDPGHPIIEVAPNAWVQIDFMPHPEALATWGRFRATPERGVKGLLRGNLFSILGQLLNLNVQHAGVQYKERDGVRMPYTDTKKDYVHRTLSTNIETFVKDIFDHEYKTITGKDPTTAKIDPLLQQYQGSKTDEVKISDLVNAIKGMARSFQINKMYGKGTLSEFKNYDDFINEFLKNYEGKAMAAVHAKKREKAESPEAIARAQADKESITNGLEKVKGMFK